VKEKKERKKEGNMLISEGRKKGKMEGRIKERRLII
jgi:hypothetical protein